MGSITPKILADSLEIIPFFANQRPQRLLKTLLKLKGLFCSQLVTLAIQGFLLGYYATSIVYLCKKNLQEVKKVSAMCPVCNAAAFQIICKNCGKVISCGQCYQKVIECPKCCQSLKEETSVVKIYMA